MYLWSSYYIEWKPTDGLFLFYFKFLIFLQASRFFKIYTWSYLYLRNIFERDLSHFSCGMSWLEKTIRRQYFISQRRSLYNKLKKYKNWNIH